MTETKITGRQIIVIASLIFGVLFGAGNLIFPVHLISGCSLVRCE